VKLARFRTPEGPRLFAGRDGSAAGGWVALADIAGFQAPDQLTDLLSAAGQAELRAALDALPATAFTTMTEGAESTAGTAGTDPRLQDAATVVQTGDIWGAGLNYLGHSADLNTQQPASGPGSYLRPHNCLIDNGQQIMLPSHSKRVTAEAELGLIIGTECKNVARSDWRSVVAGVTAVLDLTAEDVIRENPRYIPWAKGFDTFCSVGPQVVTLDEFDDAALRAIRVSTVLNGEVVATAPTSEMKYDLGYLVEYFTAGRTIPAGTVICTGTPGATVISSGDTVTSVVEGVGTLQHIVA
jgi:2-keto-4-pentenoate hydratase/2-oxohepta-3-ene-1,7-dioic acid hydratase in catechol pathway